MQELVDFRPNTSSKSEVKFYDQLMGKLFVISSSDIYKSLFWVGSGRKTMTKVFDYYGDNTLDIISGKTTPTSFPNKIGATTIKNITKLFVENEATVSLITNDGRYNEVVEVVVKNTKSSVSLEGKTFCFSGSFDNNRKDLQQMVKDNGGEIKSVSSKLQYFVQGEKVGPTKLVKVQKLNIAIITESEFLAMV